MIDAVCPDCGTVLEVPESLRGSQVRCGRCDCVFTAEAREGRRRRRDDRDDRDDFEDDEAPVRSRKVDQSGKATKSLTLGGLSLIAWCLPIIGLPVSITGLVMGIQSVNSRNHGQAVAGIVLSAIGLVLSLVNAALGAYLAVNGQAPAFN